MRNDTDTQPDGYDHGRLRDSRSSAALSDADTRCAIAWNSIPKWGKIIGFILYVICGGLLITMKPNYYDFLKDKDTDPWHPTNCDDFIFGCCDYYTDCSINGVNGSQTLHAEPIHMNWKTIVKHEGTGSNCPRLNEMLVEYNAETTKDDERKEIFEMVDDCKNVNGCCKVNYACDTRYYYDVLTFHNNNQDTVDYYNLFVSGGYYEDEGYSILYSESLYNYGITCPTIDEIQKVYEGTITDHTDIIYYCSVFGIIIVNIFALYFIIRFIFATDAPVHLGLPSWKRRSCICKKTSTDVEIGQEEKSNLVRGRA